MKEHTPGGAQTRSRQHRAFGGAPFPATAEYGDGAHICAEGRWYTDWTGSLASVGLGYDHPRVTGAVTGALSSIALPLPNAIESRYAGKLCGALMWPDQARFVKTGSEATAAAMMIARRETGRRKIISVGYHGWHDAHQPSAELVTIPWGSWAVFDAIDEHTAAVLMEPMRTSEPPPGYLKDIREWAHRWGALFIMDEVVTGFRWALGGATEYYDLKPPDLACFGKAMANGYPLAAVVGKADIMRHAVDVSGTFGGDVVALTAAEQVLTEYLDYDVIGHLWNTGEELIRQCDGILRGYGVHPYFAVAEGGSWLDSTVAVPFVRKALAAGHLVHPAGLNMMYAHTMNDVKALAGALRS